MRLAWPSLRKPRAELLAAVNAPLIRLIGADPAAVQALRELRNQQPLDPASPSLPRDNRIIHDTVALEDALPKAGQVRVLARVPPFDYAWSWWDPDGSGPFDQHLTNDTGAVGLIARSGRVKGGAPGFIAAHAGFGLWLSTDREVVVTCYATPRMVPRWHVGCLAPVDYAVAEAGKAFTAVEDDRVCAFAVGKLFSVFQQGPGGGHSSQGYTDLLDPPSLVFTMKPGLRTASM